MEPGSHLYQTVLFLHIMSVIVWLGGGIMIFFLSFRVMKRGPEDQQKFAEDAEFLGKKVLGMASGLTLLFGLTMALFSGGAWSITNPWILIGLVGWLISMILGAGMIGPTSGKIGKLIPEKGPEDPEVKALVKRVQLLSRIDMVLLIVIVWDMVYKPFT